MIVKNRIAILAVAILCNGLVLMAQSYTEMGLQLIPGIDSLDCSCSWGHGASFVDVDDDGWPDLTITSNTGDSVVFYRNDSGVFERVYPPVGDLGRSNTLIWADLDNDGDKDLVIANYGQQNKIYRCDGPWEYIDVTGQSGMLNINDYSSQVSAGDVNNDGLLDIFIANYQSTGYRDFLYINEGNMNFTEASLDWDLPDEAKTTFTGVFVDFNRDGWQDLYLIVDRYENSNRLYQNIGGEYFEDVTGGSGADISIDAMDAGIGDFNEDGWMDVYVTNSIPGNVLLKNLGNMQFVDYTDTAGVNFYRTGWGGNFFDMDNDMDMDLHVCSMEGTPADPNAMYINQGPPGYFFNETNIYGDTSSSFCEIISDFNNDGYIDFFLVNNNFFRYQLFVNDADGGQNWIKVRLQGTESNRDGVGAQITAHVAGRNLSNYVNCGEAYLAQNDFVEHFGLGGESEVDTMIVYWPSGIRDTFYNLQANQTHLLIEDSSNGGQVAVSGETFLLNGEPAGAYEIFVSGDMTDSIDSEADGSFSLDVPMASTIELTPYKNDEWSSGVSIVDLVEILQHITQTDLLDSPYEYIAADANASETISISDLVILLQIITGELGEVSGNTSYRFVPADYQFSDPQNPLQENFPESINLTDIQAPTAVEFKGIKVGNVNY